VTKPIKVPMTMEGMRSLARAHTELSIKTLAGIAGQPKCPPSAGVMAAGLLLERRVGQGV
jgi:hypothetical protein